MHWSDDEKISIVMTDRDLWAVECALEMDAIPREQEERAAGYGFPHGEDMLAALMSVLHKINLARQRDCVEPEELTAAGITVELNY